MVNEVFRAAPNSLSVDLDNPNWVICELVIPADVGGWYVREAGVFDDAGTLLCIAKVPESCKGQLTDGTPYQMVVEVAMLVVSADAVSLDIDTSTVLASVTYVNNVQTAVSQQIADTEVALAQQITNVASASAVSAQIPGGLTGEVLAKRTDADGDVKWRRERNPYTYFAGQF